MIAVYSNPSWVLEVVLDVYGKSHVRPRLKLFTLSKPCMCYKDVVSQQYVIN